MKASNADSRPRSRSAGRDRSRSPTKRLPIPTDMNDRSIKIGTHAVAQTHMKSSHSRVIHALIDLYTHRSVGPSTSTTAINTTRKPANVAAALTAAHAERLRKSPYVDSSVPASRKTNSTSSPLKGGLSSTAPLPSANPNPLSTSNMSPTRVQKVASNSKVVSPASKREVLKQILSTDSADGEGTDYEGNFSLSLHLCL